MSYDKNQIIDILHQLNQKEDDKIVGNYINQYQSEFEAHQDDLLFWALEENLTRAYKHLAAGEALKLNINNRQKNTERTLIHIAAVHCDEEFMNELLKDTDINPYLKDAQDKTAFELALDRYHQNLDDTTTVMLQSMIDHHLAIDIFDDRELPDGLSFYKAIVLSALNFNNLDGAVVTGNEKEGFYNPKLAEKRIRQALDVIDNESVKIILNSILSDISNNNNINHNGNNVKTNDGLQDDVVIVINNKLKEGSYLDNLSEFIKELNQRKQLFKKNIKPQGTYQSKLSGNNVTAGMLLLLETIGNMIGAFLQGSRIKI